MFGILTFPTDDCDFYTHFFQDASYNSLWTDEHNYKIIWPLSLCDQLKLYAHVFWQFRKVQYRHSAECLRFIFNIFFSWAFWALSFFSSFAFPISLHSFLMATWYPKRKISPLKIPIKINETKSNANHEWNEWQRKNYSIFYSIIDSKSGKLSKMVCFGTNGT